MQQRCGWCLNDPLNVDYHDHEWGVPLRDSQRLFGKLILDGFQAGLSWLCVLRKRPGFEAVFCGFDPARMARFGAADTARLMHDPGIVRNRAKIEAAVRNARAYCCLAASGTSLAEVVWGVTGGEVLQPSRRADGAAVTQTPQSKQLSADLKKLGFSFCGPVICYAFMQAVGVVNDHVTTCFRHPQLSGQGRRAPPGC
ncbi:MAG: DNA-3-methyladenine glycosylase I [Deltaproteobacteria bacterium]|nr:MAG: DNA-3-methyladenine glycosylase I [Deltaproteobacteria bacterium]